MNPDIHPSYQARKFTCSCGAVYNVASTLDEDSTLDICSQCHPFYTGKQKLVDTAGRVDKFRKRFGMQSGAEKAKDN